MSISMIRKLSLLLAILAVTSLACSISVDTGQKNPTDSSPPSATQENLNPPQASPLPPAQNVPTLPPPPPPTPESNLYTVNFNGVSFSYDKSLAASVTTEKIPAVPYDPQGPYWDFNPETLKFSFNGYILQNTFHSPIIHVYPVADFQAMDASITGKVAELQTLIANKPPAPESIPFLPIWNAAQFMQANVSYFNFLNGSGVRFLSMYGQAASPVNNTSLFYAFQGLSNDGAYYISAVLPVSHSSLPSGDSDIPGGDYNAFADNFPNYIIDMENQLSSQPATSFLPDLALLDATIQSFLIQWQR
jgi:hypothetical protein